MRPQALCVLIAMIFHVKASLDEVSDESLADTSIQRRGVWPQPITSGVNGDGPVGQDANLPASLANVWSELQSKMKKRELKETTSAILEGVLQSSNITNSRQSSLLETLKSEGRTGQNEKSLLMDVDAKGSLAYGWPPLAEGQCSILTGESWKVLAQRMKQWLGSVAEREYAMLDKAMPHSTCCGLKVPFGPTTSYTYAGGGCPAFVVNTNFMDVAIWHFAGGAGLSSVSGGSWYTAADQYGMFKWPDGRGNRFYLDGDWNKTIEETELEGHILGFDSLCTTKTAETSIARGIFKSLVDESYKLYMAWTQTVSDAFLDPIDIPLSLEFGQAVSQYEWPEEVCADWSPVTTVLKRDGHTDTPFTYGLFPYYRKDYNGKEKYIWGDEFTTYSNRSFASIIAASSSYFLGSLGMAHDVWAVLCQHFPRLKGCLINSHYPPAWFDDLINEYRMTAKKDAWKDKLILDSGKPPFVKVDAGLTEDGGWNCPKEPMTVIGWMKANLDPSYSPCLETDGAFSDSSGILENIMTREYVTWESKYRAFYNQNRIITVQAHADLGMLPLLCGMPRDFKDSRWKTSSMRGNADQGSPYGTETFAPYDIVSPYHALEELLYFGWAFFPAFVKGQYDLGTQGNYSVFLSFTAMVKNSYARDWRDKHIPEVYRGVAKRFKFPEYDVQFSFPTPAAQILAIYAEMTAVKLLYLQRWSGHCWHWLSYMSREEWFQDALCFCIVGPWDYHADQGVTFDPLAMTPWYAWNMRKMEEGYGYSTNHPDHKLLNSTEGFMDYLLGFNEKSAAHVDFSPPWWDMDLHWHPFCRMGTLDRFHELRLIIDEVPKSPTTNSFLLSEDDADERWAVPDWNVVQVTSGLSLQEPVDSHGGMFGSHVRGTSDYAANVPEPVQDQMEEAAHGEIDAEEEAKKNAKAITKWAKKSVDFKNPAPGDVRPVSERRSSAAKKRVINGR